VVAITIPPRELQLNRERDQFYPSIIFSTIDTPHGPFAAIVCCGKPCAGELPSEFSPPKGHPPDARAECSTNIDESKARILRQLSKIVRNATYSSLLMRQLTLFGNRVQAQSDKEMPTWLANQQRCF
jgi:hypothetical protein